MNLKFFLLTYGLADDRELTQRQIEKMDFEQTEHLLELSFDPLSMISYSESSILPAAVPPAYLEPAATTTTTTTTTPPLEEPSRSDCEMTQCNKTSDSHAVIKIIDVGGFDDVNEIFSNITDNSTFPNIDEIDEGHADVIAITVTGVIFGCFTLSGAIYCKLRWNTTLVPIRIFLGMVSCLM